MKAHNFRQLTIWKESMVLVKMVYRLTNQLPDKEKFGLVSQINRCAVSVPSNIAEGSGRTTEKDFLRFLTISISSSYELETQLLIIEDIYNIKISETLDKLKDIQNMIGGFKRNILN
ncbi:MAG TPA: four helix bundle protein [Crocinitomicaceae bacterium]|nr:four helix bundle protein [Crocinitomicaceae bacterium]